MSLLCYYTVMLLANITLNWGAGIFFSQVVRDKRRKSLDTDIPASLSLTYIACLLAVLSDQFLILKRETS